MVSGQRRTAAIPTEPRLVDGLAADAMLGVVADVGSPLNRGAHRHPHGELFLLRSGYVKSETAAGRWLIPAGHLCWVPPQVVHGGEMTHARGMLIHVSADLCAALPGAPCVMSSTPLIVAVMDRLAAANGRRTALSGAQTRLLAVLGDEIGSAGGGPPILLPMPRDPRLRRTVERWLGAPDDVSRLDALAEEAGMSRRSFTRNFKRDTGMPVGEWRQVARLMHAIDLLGAGESVTGTAFALGYDSISSFVALCRRHTGMSPRLLGRAVARGGAQNGRSPRRNT